MDPATHTLIVNNCNGPTVYGFATTGAGAPAPVQPPPNPQQVAQTAIGKLHVITPAMNVGPDPNKIAVNFWSWLWSDNPGEKTATASATTSVTVTVTARAQLTSVTWSMGEPINIGNPAAGISAVTCTGLGQAPGASADLSAQPPCGYMFKYRSLKSRTNGTGVWQISSTSTWGVTWQAYTNGAVIAQGATTLTSAPANALQISVGEYRTAGGYGQGS